MARPIDWRVLDVVLVAFEAGLPVRRSRDRVREECLRRSRLRLVLYTRLVVKEVETVDDDVVWEEAVAAPDDDVLVPVSVLEGYDWERIRKEDESELLGAFFSTKSGAF